MNNKKHHHHFIKSCYKNDFGIDLQNYHNKICKISDKEQNLIDEINSKNRIVFQDGLSEAFELQIHFDLVFLVGERSSYICSNVIESAYGDEFNWVMCLVIPSNNLVLGETDIKKSGVIVSLFSDLIPHIPDSDSFDAFIRGIEFTFQNCDWFKRIFSLSLYVTLATFWDYKEKLVKLFEEGLLYPTEFILYVIFMDKDIRNTQVLNFFIDSLAESTNQIFSNKEICSFFLDLSHGEIEEVLAVDFVKENINIEFLSHEALADLLKIDGIERYGMFVEDVYYIDHMKNRASLIFNKPGVIRKHVKILKKNFRALENRLRKRKGFDKVGTFFTEKLLVQKLKEHFPYLNIIPQYSPQWLSPQRLDVFIEECNIAVEYQGIQHFVSIDFFGGTEGLNLRKNLDRIKRIKCLENNVKLIEITYEDDFEFSLKALIEKINLIIR